MCELFSLKNEAGRRHTDKLISDSGGRSFDSQGKGRHTMVNEKVDPRKHAAMIFAKKVAERIEKALHEGSCRGYALVIAPRFLGILRNALGTATSVEPYATVDKEMLGRDVTAIEELLANL
jgi:protein required for attachment to host cells